MEAANKEEFNSELEKHFEMLVFRNMNAHDAFSRILKRDIRLNKKFPDMRVNAIAVYQQELRVIEDNLCDIVDGMVDLGELIGE
jgi:hypothetical protein